MRILDYQAIQAIWWEYKLLSFCKFAVIPPTHTQIIDKNLSGYAAYEHLSHHPLVVTAFEQLAYYCTKNKEIMAGSKGYLIDSSQIEVGDLECVLCAG